MESSRTSPAANTPGTLVSRVNGGRGSGQCSARPEANRSWPVMMNPLSSRTTPGPSHSVRGVAPMKTNSQLDDTSSVTPESPSARVSLSRWPSPSPATTWLLYRTSMLGVDMILLTRYWDIVLMSVGARTTSTTRLAKRDRWSAAWPAELAAPTMYTSSPWH